MVVTKGRIVFVIIDPALHRGDDVCPAVVIQSNDTYVDVMALPDAGPRVMRDVVMCADEQNARALLPEVRRTGAAMWVAFWPPRV